jgi:hypothetical protein
MNRKEIEGFLDDIGNYNPMRKKECHWMPTRDAFRQLCQLALKGLNSEDAEDARRFRAWRDGDVIVRGNHIDGYEARHRDDPHWDIGSWHWSPELCEAIDAANRCNAAEEQSE